MSMGRLKSEIEWGICCPNDILPAGNPAPVAQQHHPAATTTAQSAKLSTSMSVIATRSGGGERLGSYRHLALIEKLAKSVWMELT